MAKKNMKSTDQTAPRRRATPKRAEDASRENAAPAAPPVDIAGVSGTEPLATAPDTGAAAPAFGNGDSRQPPTYDEIAEAAYYRHLKRGGHEGGEFDDWIEAERELRERRSR